MNRSLRILHLKKSAPSIYDPGQKTTPVEDQTGSTFNRGDFTAINAFFWSSLNLSAYHGTDGGSTPYFIELIDAGGKKASGYLGAVGAGETLGGEVLANPTFDVNVNGWSLGECTLASIVGGQSNNCLEMTRESGTSQAAFQDIDYISLALYKTSGYVKSGTSGNELSRLQVYDFSTASVLRLELVSSGSWQQFSPSYILLAGPSRLGLYKMSSTEGTMLFDEVSFKRVTDPPSTAVHIVSSLNGTIRNWASIESGFDPNNIASWIIYG